MDNKSKMYRCDNTKEFNNNRIVYASYNDNNNVLYDINDIRQ